MGEPLKQLAILALFCQKWPLCHCLVHSRQIQLLRAQPTIAALPAHADIFASYLPIASSRTARFRRERARRS
jgi:hypothetical protein